MLCFLISPPDAYTDDLPGVIRVDSLTPVPGLLRDEMERIDDGKNGTAAFAARPRIVISDAIDSAARAGTGRGCRNHRRRRHQYARPAGSAR